MLRPALASVYLLAWAVVFGLAAFVAATWLAILLHDRLQVLPDDDWPLWIWPIGCVVGFWFGYRSLEWRRFQWASLLVGIVAAVVLLVLAGQYWTQSESLIGVKGPFSGLAERLAAIACAVLSATAAVVAAGSAAALFRAHLALRRAAKFTA